MDNEQAKSILRACRDASDPLVAEALEYARRDPALARWLEEEQALDAAIAGQLRSIKTPAGLKASILARAEAAPAATRSWWRTLITAAALLVFGAIAFAVWFPIVTWRTDSFATFQADMGEFLSGEFRLQFQNAELPELQHWLAERHVDHYQIPSALIAATRPTGCRTIDWNGKKIGLLCFYTPDGKVVHFAVIARADLPDAPTFTRPKYARRGEWTSATWSGGDKVYFVMTPLDEARLRTFL